MVMFFNTLNIVKLLNARYEQSFLRIDCIAYFLVARLAQMLRQLASYYYKDPSCLFMVRIAQGLLHMGKGMISVNPFHSNRFLLSPVAMAGLLATFISFTDVKNSKSLTHFCAPIAIEKIFCKILLFYIILDDV